MAVDHARSRQGFPTATIDIGRMRVASLNENVSRVASAPGRISRVAINNLQDRLWFINRSCLRARRGCRAYRQFPPKPAGSKSDRDRTAGQWFGESLPHANGLKSGPTACRCSTSEAVAP